MRLGHVELFVRDPRVSRDFYERILGCEVTAVQHEMFVWLRFGEAQILLRPGPPPHPSRDYQSCGAAIVVYCDDLPLTRRELESRGLLFRGDDGPECPTFTDPDGHWFQLVDPKGA